MVLRPTVLLASILTLFILIFGNRTLAQWSQTNGPQGGAITSILVYGSSDFLASTAGAGIFRSTNGGINWTLAAGNPLDRFATLLASNNSTMFAGASATLFCSSDEGITWNTDSVGLSAIGSVYTLTIEGSDFYAGGDHGVYHSTVAGGDWSPMNTSILDVSSIAVDDSLIIVSAYYGLYRSTDFGASWETISLGITLDHSYPVTIGFAFGKLFTGTHKGLLVSTDHGSNWSIAVTDSVHPRIEALCVVDSVIYAGGENLFGSSDSGKTWTKIGPRPQRPQPMT
jgi:photosystem II stability/assembly factor-like uncharacterized protein